MKTSANVPVAKMVNIVESSVNTVATTVSKAATTDYIAESSANTKNRI